MKPKTRLQNLVVELSKKLPKITEEEKKWAFDECLYHLGFATKNKVLCMDCGETFSPELVVRKKAVCPHCNTKLDVVQTRRTTNKQTIYFAKAVIYEEFQVIENYEMIVYYKAKSKAKICCWRILEHWILPNGKREVIGHNHHYSWHGDSWTGDWEIRNKSDTRKYDVYPQRFLPKSVFKKMYTKYGINKNLRGMTFLEAILNVPTNPKAETLLKAKYYSILGQFLSYDRKVEQYWSSVKICFRNNYKVKDASMWFDYLDLLRFFNKDLHNAKYVCPKNLKKEHDRLVKKKREILNAQQRERERQAAIKRQQNLERAISEYVERTKIFFDLEFKSQNISIKVLQSVQEFKEEGEELNHCVYVNEYYSKENSLIFSARVDGVRTETIELKLSSMKIEQSRGLNNVETKHHKSIINLMKKNIDKIIDVINKKEKVENQNSKQSA